MGRTYSDKVVAGDPMKGAHVRILRSYIQQDLNAASISFTWSWSNWSAGQDAGQPVRAVYFQEMRNAIQALWDSKGRGHLPDWTQETPKGSSTGDSSASVIRATHVTDLRVWLNQYENNHPPLTQGINSNSYYPFSDDQPVIYDATPNDWSSDVKSLSDARLFIRTVITGRIDPNDGRYTVEYTSVDYAKFRSAFLQYDNQNMKVFLVFTRLFFKPSDDYTSEPYRIAFANKLTLFLEDMLSHGIEFEGIMVWNEPNDRPGAPDSDYLTGEQFARLLHRCWLSISQSSALQGHAPKIYWGGIFTTNDEHYVDAVTYMKSVYDFIRLSGIMNGMPQAFPWDGINVHMNSVRSDGDAYGLLRAAKDLQIINGDYGELIVGEWGVTLDDGPDDMSDLYAAILQGWRPISERVRPDIMFYFSHPVVEDSNGKWGLRFTEAIEIAGANRFRLNPYLSPKPEDMKALDLRNRYTSIQDG